MKIERIETPPPRREEKYAEVYAAIEALDVGETVRVSEWPDAIAISAARNRMSVGMNKKFGKGIFGARVVDGAVCITRKRGAPEGDK